MTQTQDSSLETLKTLNLRQSKLIKSMTYEVCVFNFRSFLDFL